MATNNFPYPANPLNVPDSVIQPSPAFRKEVSGVMGSVIFFFIVYLILFLLSIALAIGCFYGGIQLIINLPKLITIVAGLGLISVGVMVFVFLVKFLFAVARYDRSGIIEVTEEQQPVLFAFIRQLAKDTQTKFPKRIYLSADVNACVFYDSSFWSMFLPVKKNLQIGLGLVNALNVSEFKAVMAHEFGHFSQRSMKLGSFVYNVNKIIHNMLFENRSYAGFLQSWANIDGIFAIFTGITIKIAQGIQWILGKMYGLINKNYMRLSREMEFHADAVAASVSGSKSLVTALRRVELANSGYTIALQKCDELYRQKKISGNIYKNQYAVLLQLANDFKLPLQQGLPVVSDEFLKENNLARINYKDQWASHPTTEDREAHLNQLGIVADEMQGSAWVLFSNREQLEAELTQKVYQNVEKAADTVTIDHNEFEEKLHGDLKTFSNPVVYNGFYDNRQVDIAAEQPNEIPTEKKFDEIFSVDNASLAKRIAAAANDLEVVKAIAEKRINTKTFDFDGVKYDRKDTGTVIAQLEKEIKAMQEQLIDADKAAIQLFYQQAKQKGEAPLQELKVAYRDYFIKRREADVFLQQVNSIMELLQPIFSGQVTTVEQVNVIIDDLKNDHEGVFKKMLREWREAGAFANDGETSKTVNTYVDSHYSYFGGNSFFENELMNLNNTCGESWSAINNFLFGRFKAILETQERYLH